MAIVYALYVAPGFSATWAGTATALSPGITLVPSAAFLVAFTALVLYLRGNTDTHRPAIGTTLRWAAVAAGALAAAAAIFVVLRGGVSQGNASLFARAPADGVELGIAVAFLLVAATAEEALFRAYLIPRLRSVGLAPISAVLVAAAAFAIGHLYQGVPGIAFSLAAATLLGALWLRFPYLPSFVIAHGAYNVAVFLISL